MADEKSEVIVSEVGATEQDVNAIRTEMTQQASAGGSPGARIDRLPYNERFALLERSGIYSQRFGSTERCIRTVDVPEQGGITSKYHCSRPIVSVGDAKYCPDHDRASLQPIQTPVPKGRVINSASIPLTKGELDEVQRISKSNGVPQTARGADAPLPILAPPVEGASQVRISFTLEELAGGNVLKIVSDRLVAALDSLPCANVRQMRDITRLQDKLVKMGKARAKRDISSEDNRAE